MLKHYKTKYIFFLIPVILFDREIRSLKDKYLRFNML